MEVLGGCMKQKYIILSSFIACICLYVIEQALGVNYAVKTISKLLLFILIPYIYIKFIKGSNIITELNLRDLDKSRFKLGFIFACVSFLIVLLGYFIFKGAIDLNSIAQEMQNKSKITPANFLLVGLYVTVGNSFLEEFFFRGFIFLNLYNMKKEKLAYVYSSLLFGLYHIAIFKTWFNVWITLLCLLALVTVGFIFNWLNTKSNNFINSWLVHIFADAAIIFIGLRMFEMI
jgi:membrane protease YdiL (CAAX protease family)